jgi:pantoate--beta-alanine ligase
MIVFDTPVAMRAWSNSQRAVGHIIAVVPTMGALHDGHMALIGEARSRADVVVVTIFVNPLQFNQSTDFDRYPRPIDGDLDACKEAGVDAVYAPTAAMMYPARFQTHVVPGDLSDRLEGTMRPGHFEGVATVVTKLFGATGPDLAVFGQKDFQQLAIVRQMVADLNMGIEIVGSPIVRESDGLAKSSRNQRLSPIDRQAAPVISRALDAAHEAFGAGERDPNILRRLVVEMIEAERSARLEYVELVDADSLVTVDRIDSAVVILTAAWFSDVRLIDNRLLGG